MGGLVGDQGSFSAGDAVFTVTDTQKTKAGKYLHYGEVTKGEFDRDQEVTASVDTTRRKAIQRAHSATHLLQRALQDVLGNHVQQAGSLVDSDHLRFDFTHFSAITSEELIAIEKQVNEAILEGY